MRAKVDACIENFPGFAQYFDDFQNIFYYLYSKFNIIMTCEVSWFLPDKFSAILM